MALRLYVVKRKEISDIITLSLNLSYHLSYIYKIEAIIIIYGSIYLCQQGSPVAYVIKLILSSIRQVIFLTLLCSLMTFELFLFRFKTFGAICDS